MNKMYYGPENTSSNSHRLSPMPTMSIDTQISYANDVIIGYTYIVNLNGYATAFRKLTEQIVNDADKVKNFSKVMPHIDDIRETLSRNGSYLTLYDEDNNRLIKCKGGTLRSLSFNESENRWTSYAPYTAQIEFNEVEILSESLSCAAGFIDPSSLTSDLVDTSKYKIKSFTDNWSFTVDDQAFNASNANGVILENMRVGVQYSISATGQHYYVGSSLSPAWTQAKNFVQDRLYRVVSNLVVTLGSTSRILKNTGSDNCSASDTLNTIHRNLSTGVFNGFGQYRVYNETLSCETSESDGTFSATYNSILKKNTTSAYSANNVIHTLSKNINTTYDSAQKKSVSISIEGSVEGLFEGGLIRSAGSLRMPQNGTLLIGGNLASKYNNAMSFLNSKILDGDDLKPALKTALTISREELGLGNQPCGTSAAPPAPIPSSFNLTRNYMEGIITYNVEYSSDRECAGSNASVASASVSVENPVDIFAELIIPAGPFHDGEVIIQDIGTKTPRKISISIEGRASGSKKCCGIQDLDNMLGNYCTDIGIPSGITLPDPTLYILTQKQKQENLVDGSYTLNLGYTCTAGCSIGT